MKTVAKCLLGLLPLLLPCLASAEEPAGLRIGGETGTALLGDSALAHLTLWATTAQKLGELEHVLAVSAPLRLVVRDATGGPNPAPTNPNCRSPALRCEDWDDRGEWTRILRHWHLGSKSGGWQVQAGEVTAATIGHGSLVQRYFAGARFDRYRTGATAQIDAAAWGLQLLAGDVTAPHTFAGRAWLRPARTTGAGTFAVAAQAGWDAAWDSDRPATDQRAPRVGLDTEVTLWQAGPTRLQAYADWLVAFAGGGGLHAGLDLRHAPTKGNKWSLQAEARLLRGQYRPVLLDPTSELDRLTGAGTPGNRSGFWSGAMASADVEVAKSFRWVTQVDWGERTGLGVLTWLTTESWEGLSLRLHAGQRWMQDRADVTDVDRLYLASQLRFAVSGPWFATTSVARRWLDRGGSVSPVWEGRLSAGAEWQW
jgi:hypothetical protein